jgi:hypothetical protein
MRDAKSSICANCSTRLSLLTTALRVHSCFTVAIGIFGPELNGTCPDSLGWCVSRLHVGRTDESSWGQSVIQRTHAGSRSISTAQNFDLLQFNKVGNLRVQVHCLTGGRNRDHQRIARRVQCPPLAGMRLPPAAHGIDRYCVVAGKFDRMPAPFMRCAREHAQPRFTVGQHLPKQRANVGGAGLRIDRASGGEGCARSCGDHWPSLVTLG